MTILSPRGMAGILVVAGVTIGTLSDRFPTRLPFRAEGYEVLAGDFHVHAFPGDGALAPWTLRDEARRAGLDVLAVTNHNRTFTARFAGWLSSQSDGPIVIPGEEITALDYHLIAIGVDRTVSSHQPAAGAIADVHAQGGLAIAAHPMPSEFHGYDDDATVAQLDGTEAAHPARERHDQEQFAAFFDRARRLNPRVAPIGSSDFHVSPQLGLCRTFIFVRARTAAGTLEAIRNGRTVASDEWGRLYGDPALVKLLERDSPAGRSEVNARWRRLSLMLVWVGVAGMLLLQGRHD
jgi:predicted metal-dependent phosphoesterase TrpH